MIACKEAEGEVAGIEPAVEPVMSVIAVLAFFVVDLALVVGALVWLSRQRAMNDITDLRFRNRRRR